MDDRAPAAWKGEGHRNSRDARQLVDQRPEQHVDWGASSGEPPTEVPAPPMLLLFAAAAAALVARQRYAARRG
ncbi:hypothetical protein ACMT1E_10470 [Sphingomonas flavalba]|uniref:hypothetical protein n=1 Tax=Sphingomonas flavalba TaxID=2559804 RepID=UPI0039E19618